MTFEASSAVSRLHGSIEPGVGCAPPPPPVLAVGWLDGEPVVLGLDSGIAVAVSGATATWDVVGADGDAADVLENREMAGI
jgi:hypothetical protein